MTEEATAQGSALPADPRYVEARRVLLDALTALAPHGASVIVAGAQAVYLRTGDADIAVAPYTTDGDLALDPSLLGDSPALEAAMTGAGFHLAVEPGIWLTTTQIEGVDVVIPVDLIVPDGAAPAGGRRGARLGVHGNHAARRAVGLEAALVDHSAMEIAALDPSDTRAIQTEVAGAAALLVSKAHKLHDRVGSGRADRLNDKDAADVLRIMQVTDPAEVGATLAMLCAAPIAAGPSAEAVTYLQELFGRRGRPGVQMAARALRVAMPEARVEAICLGYMTALGEGLGDSAAG
jgi:hypothetical protein